MQTGRIYIVTTPKGKRVVEAISKNAAIRFVADTEITAELVKGREGIDLIAQGVKLESALDPQMDLVDILDESGVPGV